MSSSRPPHRSTNRASSSSDDRHSSRSGPSQAPHLPDIMLRTPIYAPPPLIPGYPPPVLTYPQPSPGVFHPIPNQYGFHPSIPGNPLPPGPEPWLMSPPSTYAYTSPMQGFVEREVSDSDTDEEIRRAMALSTATAHPEGNGITIREATHSTIPVIQPSSSTTTQSGLRQDQREWLARRPPDVRRDHENFERFAKAAIDKAIDRDRYDSVFFETFELNYTTPQLLRTICYMAKKLKEKDPDSSLGYSNTDDRRAAASSSSRSHPPPSHRATRDDHDTRSTRERSHRSRNADEDDRRSTISSANHAHNRHSHDSNSHRHSSGRTASRATSPTPSRASTHTSRARRPTASSSRPLREVVSQAALARRAASDRTTAAPPASEDRASRIQELEDELRELRRKAESRKCKICLDNDSDTIFLGCHHVPCCFECLQLWSRENAKNCPICRTDAREAGVARVYFS